MTSFGDQQHAVVESGGSLAAAHQVLKAASPLPRQPEGPSSLTLSVLGQPHAKPRRRPAARPENHGYLLSLVRPILVPSSR